MTSLEFRNGNPGSVQYGNFINYYNFHPAENRIQLLPEDIWNKNVEFVGLDIGCNSGDLTLLLYKFLSERIDKSCRLLGIDIDPTLIERGKEKNEFQNVNFTCLNFMDETRRTDTVNNYLRVHNKRKFSATFCFSTTMWIHLNYGDEGLFEFLKIMCDLSEIIVIEPQPWRCYKTAVKRLKLSNETFPHFKNLQIRQNVESEIEQLIKSRGFVKVKETEKTSWGRKLLFFHINEM